MAERKCLTSIYNHSNKVEIDIQENSNIDFRKSQEYMQKSRNLTMIALDN